MDIDEMPAGREMDALVAEKVMGWASVAFGHECSHGGIYSAWGPYTEPVGKPPDLSGTDMVPRYSTDIAAAWQVVSRMIALDEKDHWFELEHHRHIAGEAWYATFSDWGIGETAPLAICRAALKAKGETP